MKKITTEQIQAILQSFFEINAPVKLYTGLQKLLTELPDCKEEPKEEIKTPDDFLPDGVNPREEDKE